MILTKYEYGVHGPLSPNLAFDSKIESPLGDVFQVVQLGKEQVFVQFERFSWESFKKEAIAFEENGKAIWIRYFANSGDTSLVKNALKIAVLDYLDVFYLNGAGIEFIDGEMNEKKFAEIVHGFRAEERFEPFLELQWQPFRTQTGIRFIFEPKR